jgi:hypothetical protein
MNKPPFPGTCRHCGCTESEPCLLPSGGGDTCGWFDKSKKCCSNYPCVKAELARRARTQPRPLTSADVHQLIRRKKAHPRRRVA